MTAENFERALAHILVFEGGNDDDPQDPGGRTSRGIIQSEYNVYRRRKGLPTRDVWHADDAEIREIYRTSYWDKVRGDDLPAGVDVVLFDGAVNSGLGQQAKWTQRALGVEVTGRFDEATFAAIAADKDNDALIAGILSRRIAMLEGLRTWSRFGKGWSARVDSIRKIGQAWACGSVGPDPVDVLADGGHKKTSTSAPATEMADYEIRAVQAGLSSLGYPAGKADGAWGRLTIQAAIGFQHDHGLAETGQWSPECRTALDAALATRQTASVSDARAATTADDLRAAGSTTVAAADSTTQIGGAIGTVGTVVGIAKGADASGLADKIKDATDQVSVLKGSLDTLGDLGSWVAAHWWIAAIAAGVAVVWYGRKIIAARLGDHRSGANTAR